MKSQIRSNVVPHMPSSRLRIPRQNIVPSVAIARRGSLKLRRSLSESFKGSFVVNQHQIQSTQRRLCSSASSSDSRDQSSESQIFSFEDLNSDMFVLKPDLGAGGLPPLPAIKSSDLCLQIFTHRSYFARPRHDFEDAPNDPSPDNEVLEHLGDAVLGLIVTGLIRECYRLIRVGPATKMRALVIGNATLADISIKYGLPERLRLHRAQAMTLRTSVHVQADALEAYIGGVYSDQGIEATSDWVKLLFRPYVKEAYRIVREQYGLLPDPESPLSPPPSPARTDTEGFSGLNHDLASTGMHANSTGHLSLFNQYVQQRQIIVDWVYETERDNAMKATPMWIVRANIDGRQIAVGRGTTKKSAQNDAAMKSLANLNASGTR